MTSIGDILGSKADDLARENISVGDVHILPLGKAEGITPKNGQNTRDKFFIVLGFDSDGNIIGGIVINSEINRNLPTTVTDYLMRVTTKQLPFLKHDSFVNCSRLKTVSKAKFNTNTFIGHIEDAELMGFIIGAVIESPYSNRQQLKEFGIIKA